MAALARGHRSFPILVAVTFNEEYDFGKGRGKCRWDYTSDPGPTSKAPRTQDRKEGGRVRCGFESHRWNVA